MAAAFELRAAEEGRRRLRSLDFLSRWSGGKRPSPAGDAKRGAPSPARGTRKWERVGVRALLRWIM